MPENTIRERLEDLRLRKEQAVAPGSEKSISVTKKVAAAFALKHSEAPLRCAYRAGGVLHGRQEAPTWFAFPGTNVVRQVAPPILPVAKSALGQCQGPALWHQMHAQMLSRRRHWHCTNPLAGGSYAQLTQFIPDSSALSRG